MATRTATKINATEQGLIRQAKRRLDLPANWIEVKYIHDTDLLTVRYSRNPTAKTKDEPSEGLIYNYDVRGKLTSIEILDLYDIFVGI